MICTCGGTTITAHERHHGPRLTYQRCGSCGRCDHWRLIMDGQHVTTGVQARRQYRTVQLTTSGDKK